MTTPPSWRDEIVIYYYLFYINKVALGNRGMTVEAARKYAKDRKEWRALVHNNNVIP